MGLGLGISEDEDVFFWAWLSIATADGGIGTLAKGSVHKCWDVLLY